MDASRGSADCVTVGGERDVDVAPRGIRVRTHLMRGCNQPRRLLRILNLRKGDVELHGKLEATVLSGKEAHMAVDRDVAHFGALPTTHRAESTLEAGRKTHR